ncbi:hypothetical protein EHI8A_050810 [Entamoeba histolytica HM-1:IMSS-B]|uniref:Leucine-rich repeat containing protein n=6 Tax=Entamoeba histolytica TaxID=5759 RepID=C4LW38_ENTH1|nr:hypothetical protein EHI_141920 [Entamoeba histolytica HM-1:IMSS]EMD47608.1 Hypothetical protein EHI5A_035610 [Entamoeba histolytica KU27]EMH72058.1 hypothetical protein EHI8A_050810 [Entamoeba histolytica HM-1:IMSS-B]EMS14366.1 hypothetical protein KM1_046180 [Entamoeba histolytica HM-3:IMSS]ENY60029.1 hypothetical protein EHI7A_006400 [Entamoeba histolytica HM-1:IMSS-A]GAT92910.1 hypothetical protein CL6EHI_141920 [Entamoeba histolytica]|eukprot:XP_654637.1 hypothetical protein EHI_141920 [Entamoeba histolytica HM-1:IMSS]
MTSFTSYFKLDDDSINKVIEYVTIEDILPLKLVNQRFFSVLEKITKIPDYQGNFTQKALKLFPNARQITSRLERYADIIGDEEINPEIQYNIIYTPNDVPYIPYLEQISTDIYSLTIPSLIPNCVELLPILLSMKKLEILNIDASTLFKISKYLASVLSSLLSLPSLKIIKVTSLSLTLSDHQKLIKSLFSSKCNDSLNIYIEINRIQDNNTLHQIVEVKPSNVKLVIDCNENYDSLYDLLYDNKVFYSFNRVITGIGCTVSEDSDDEAKYKDYLNCLFIRYFPRAICLNCVMNLKQVSEVENATVLYSVNENLLNKMSVLKQLTLSEQFGERKSHYDFKGLSNLTSLKVIAFESRKRVLKIPSRLKEFISSGFIYDENDIDNDGMKGFVNLNQLTRLEISKCQSIILNLPSSLKTLQLRDFPCLVELPQLQKLQSLSSITINDCQSITSLALGDNVRFITLNNCAQIQSISSFKKDYKLLTEACYQLL